MPKSVKFNIVAYRNNGLLFFTLFLLYYLIPVVYWLLFLDLATQTDYLEIAKGNLTPAEQRQISWALFGASPAERTYAEIE